MPILDNRLSGRALCKAALTHAAGGIQNRRLYRRMQEIEKLPRRDQEALLRTEPMLAEKILSAAEGILGEVVSHLRALGVAAKATRRTTRRAGRTGELRGIYRPARSAVQE